MNVMEKSKETALQITKVEIIPFRPRNGHLGFASCHISDYLYIADIALFSRPLGGLRLGFPIKKLLNGTSLDICKPLTHEAERAFENAILEKYESIMERNGTIENGIEETNQKK